MNPDYFKFFIDHLCYLFSRFIGSMTKIFRLDTVKALQKESLALNYVIFIMAM